MILIRSYLIVLVILSLSINETMQAQVVISGYRYDYDYDTMYEIGVVMDTFTEEFTSYVTSYKVFSGKETVNRKPFMTIFISHFPTERSIELSVVSSKLERKTIDASDKSNSARFRYGLYGNMIIGNKGDTIPYDSTYNFYNIVYFFGDAAKNKYVYVNQIGEIYTQMPFKYFLSAIPSNIYKADSISHELFKLEGTEQKRYANWLKEYEAIKRDSIRHEDSLQALKLNEFLVLRRDTFLVPSLDTTVINNFILKKKIQEVALNFRKSKIKFDGTFVVKTDTLGNIISTELKEVSADSHDYQLFSKQLIEEIEGIRVQMALRVFQNKLYTMQVKFDLKVMAFCDTLIQTVKWDRDSLVYDIPQYNDENVTNKLSAVLTERARYSFVLFYSEIQDEKFYYITRLKGGGRNFGDMVFEAD
jgi:hypothetical protein